MCAFYISHAHVAQVEDDDENGERKTAVLATHGLGAEEVFPMQWTGWPAPLLPYAAFVSCR